MSEVFTAPSLNPVEWFGSAASLAAVVAALVALVRKHVWKSLDGNRVVAFSVALSLALAYAGYLGKLLADNWVVFGLLAAVLASGGCDLIDSIQKKSNSTAAEGGTNEASVVSDGSDPCAKLR